MASDLIKHVSDASFEADVLKSGLRRAGGLLGRMVRSLAK